MGVVLLNTQYTLHFYIVVLIDVTVIIIMQHAQAFCEYGLMMNLVNLFTSTKTSLLHQDRSINVTILSNIFSVNALRVKLKVTYPLLTATNTIAVFFDSN